MVNNEKAGFRDSGKQLNICDLGAGTGVTSIAAANMFHDCMIVCTDGDANVVELCRENVKNATVTKVGDGSMDNFQIGNSYVNVCKYWWGDGTILEQLHKYRGTSASFDIVLVSGK